MMNEYIIAYGIPVIIFMNQFSRNTQTRCRIPEYYKVAVYAYEDYAPGQLVFAWYKNGMLMGDSGVMFEVVDSDKKLVYYPIFPLQIAIPLLKKWHMELPPKWSVYTSAMEKKAPAVNPINQQMRNLLAYARLFVSMQQRFSTPMPLGFKDVFEQLHDYPEQAIDGTVVSLINKVISQYLYMNTTVSNCRNLQEFITYLHNKYKMLDFIDSDFSQLRRLLQEEEPGMQCFF